MKLMREMTEYENKTMASFLSWIKEFQLKEWNELVDDYPCNGHEPDQGNWSVPTREHGGTRDGNLERRSAFSTNYASEKYYIGRLS